MTCGTLCTLFSTHTPLLEIISINHSEAHSHVKVCLNNVPHVPNVPNIVKSTFTGHDFWYVQK